MDQATVMSESLGNERKPWCHRGLDRSPTSDEHAIVQLIRLEFLTFLREFETPNQMVAHERMDPKSVQERLGKWSCGPVGLCINTASVRRRKDSMSTARECRLAFFMSALWKPP